MTKKANYSLCLVQREGQPLEYRRAFKRFGAIQRQIVQPDRNTAERMAKRLGFESGYADLILFGYGREMDRETIIV